MARAPRSHPVVPDEPQPNPIIVALVDAQAGSLDHDAITMGVAVGLGLAYLEARAFELIADAHVQSGKQRAATLRRAQKYLEEACAQAEGGV